MIRAGRPGGAFDYVIVGSGAAGATAARLIAEAGASVAVLEEGPYVPQAGFSPRAWPTFRRLLRDAGGQGARGRALIPVVQGRCVGGTTVVNSAIVWRMPEEVWRSWGLAEALPWTELGRHWDRIEDELSIAPTPEEAWGRNNALLGEGARALGVHAQPTTRNVKGCRGSARCLQGCPTGAKQSMLATYLPYAVAKGAAVFADARVDRVEFEGPRAAGVSGRGFRVHARKAVLVAASAIQTPQLLARSGLRSPHLGRHLRSHPGVPLMAVFGSTVDMWTGATQGYEAGNRAEGYKIETIALPPELVYARLPGVGAAWARAIADAPRTALWAVQLRAEAEGSVTERFFGADIRYDPTPADMARLRRALRRGAELFFAAGAREVLPGVHGLPERLAPGQERLLEEGPLDPGCYSWILSHLFGTARMSEDARDGVVGLDFAPHGTKGLYVLDSSLFPTNLGVNPQHSIMAVAGLAAERILEAA